MSTNTEKLQSNTSQPLPASFHAYTRPKKTASKAYSCPANVRIVNLDPTDDPSKICDAYRQISIDSRNRSIARQEAVLKKQRIKREKKEAAAALKAEKKQARRSVAKKKRTTESSQKTQAIQKWIEDTLLAGTHIDLKDITFHKYHVDHAIKSLRTDGHDIVTINSAKGQSQDQNLSRLIWSIDHFERPKAVLNDRYTSDKDLIEELLTQAFLAGYLITSQDLNASDLTVRRVISKMRNENWPICIVKNAVKEERPRGWILPCAANGLQPD